MTILAAQSDTPRGAEPSGWEQVILEAWATGWTPDPDYRVSEWADAKRVLPQQAAAEPGRWRTSRTPYLREILDCLSPQDPTQTVVFQAGAQIGKTETGLNWIGFVVDHAPGPMLMIQPTLELAKRVSRQRIDPMIEATPAIRGKIKDRRMRDSKNAILSKEFPGGQLIMTGAKAAPGLRSMPIRYLFADEVDAYPEDVDGEGDPLALADKRLTTFGRRRKKLVTSTPTERGMSRIDSEMERTDVRYYYVPCPDCDHYQRIVWKDANGYRMVWEQGPDGKHKPDSVKFICESCGTLIEERHKTWMLERGRWVPSKAGEPLTRGYHLSSLYSPIGWKSWSEVVAEFLDAKDKPLKLKTWVNTVLAETWEESGEALRPGTLAKRLEVYAAEVPNGVGVLIAAVDVQGDRLEVQVTGYGEEEESWLIAYSQMLGNPEENEVWFQLDRFLVTTFKHEMGEDLPIHLTMVDSSAFTESVYRYCKPRAPRRIYPVKGLSVSGKEIVGRPSINNRYRVRLFPLGTDGAKDAIMARLKIQRPGPGYLHLPHWVDTEYLEQLTAEKAVRRYVPGRGTLRKWIKTRPRNEALDLTVYCLAGLLACGTPFVKALGQRARGIAQAGIEMGKMAQEAGEKRAPSDGGQSAGGGWGPFGSGAGGAFVDSW